MEQNPIVIEQPTQKNPSTGLQVAALIIGIVGFVLSFVLYFSSIFRVAISAAAMEFGNSEIAQISGFGTVVLVCIVCIACLIGLILGVVGLVKSIRRPTRTVKGIVLSAIGLNFSIAGFVFAIVSGVLSSVFGMLLPHLMQM